VVRGLFAGRLSIQQSRSNQREERVDWFNPSTAHQRLCWSEAIFQAPMAGRAQTLPNRSEAGEPVKLGLLPDAERFLTMPQSVVWTISTSVFALRKTSPGTEPSHVSVRVPSPTSPTTNRSALTSSARWNSAFAGPPR
jgi:hypothetical protein